MPTLVALLPLLHDLLPLVVPVLLGWLGHVHLSNQKAEAALSAAKNAAETVAKAIAQPYVDELAKDAADGVITPEEQAIAERHAVDHALDLIPGPYLAILRVLFPGDALAGYVMGLIRGATHDLSLARLQTPADPFTVLKVPVKATAPAPAAEAPKIDPVSGRPE